LTSGVAIVRPLDRVELALGVAKENLHASVSSTPMYHPSRRATIPTSRQCSQWLWT